MIKNKIETLLWKCGLIDDEYILDRNINAMIERDEEWCRKFWQNRSVHGDMSDKEFFIYFERINKELNISANDNILSIGCGDGLLDKTIVDNTGATIYGFDFSEEKVRAAQKNNPQGLYWQQSFLENIDKEIDNVNKIYSFGVMQYCAPEDLEKFFLLQIEFVLKQKNKNVVIYHDDVPDKDLAYVYYKSFKRDIVEKYKNKMRLIFNEGSYWHDKDNVKSVVDKVCRLYNLNYSIQINEIPNHYRSNIILSIEK